MKPSVDNVSRNNQSCTRVKLCGLTSPEDVDAAVAAGADALGFVLWPGSRRAVDEAHLSELVALKKGYQLSPAASLSRFLLRPSSAMRCRIRLLVCYEGDIESVVTASLQRST